MVAIAEALGCTKKTQVLSIWQPLADPHDPCRSSGQRTGTLVCPWHGGQTLINVGHTAPNTAPVVGAGVPTFNRFCPPRNGHTGVCQYAVRKNGIVWICQGLSGGRNLRPLQPTASGKGTNGRHCCAVFLLLFSTLFSCVFRLGRYILARASIRRAVPGLVAPGGARVLLCVKKRHYIRRVSCNRQQSKHVPV